MIFPSHTCANSAGRNSIGTDPVDKQIHQEQRHQQKIIMLFLSAIISASKSLFKFALPSAKRTIDNYRFRLISLFQQSIDHIRTSHYIRLFKFRFVEPSIPYFSTKEHSYIREPDCFTGYRTPICKKPHARHLDGANMGLDISLTYPLFYFTALSNLSSFRFLSMIGTSISANTATSSTGKPIQW